MKWVPFALTILVAVGIYFSVRRAPENVTNKTAETLESSTPGSVAESRESSAIKTNVIPVAPSQIETNSALEEIDQKIDALQAASMQSDSKSFQIIVAGLKEERKEVRDAAVEAAVQFGSRDVIPTLKELAEKTSDPREKVEILDAIEFLELPSFGEIKALRRTNVAPARP